MSVGLVTFFKYKRLGFYQWGHDYSEPLDMGELLESLENWYNSRDLLPDTLPWCNEDPGYSNRKKVYLKSIKRNKETGDFIITLWRAVGDGEGSVYGIRADGRLGNDEVVNADDAVSGESVIWGEPAYYWFIPQLGIFASIKFGKSIADTLLLNRYFRDYVELRSNFGHKIKEITEGKNGSYTKVYFKSEDNENLWFRCDSRQCTKITQNADLNLIASEITHFVKREVISATISEEQNWTRYFNGLPYISKSKTKASRNIEISVDAKPTVKELENIFETYNERYNTSSDKWTNLGFRKEGHGGTFWLNEFIIRSELNISDIGQIKDSGQYSPETFFAALHLQRNKLLAPFTSSNVEELKFGTDG